MPSAAQGGVCIDTSMGFTPLDGLMMGTRSGSVDPGLLLHFLRRRGLDAAHLDHVLNHESGLLGVSQRSSDMREVLAAARILVIATREDLTILRETRRVRAQRS
jgi:acetate kinase